MRNTRESGREYAIYLPECQGREREGINILRQADAKEIPVEQRLFSEAWAILKAYRNIDAWGSEWGEVLDRVDGIRKAGRESPETNELAEGLALSVLRYLDRRAREKTGGG